MRVGVVGAGRIGEVHVSSLARGDQVSEVLLYDPDPARTHVLAAAHQVVVMPSVDALIAEVDALVIASPTPTHVELLDVAMSAGIPTFCEKPVAVDLEKVRMLAERAERTAGRVQVGFHYRFDPALRALAAGAPTRGPMFVRVHSTTEFAPSDEYLVGAGGLIADKLIHELDLVRWVTGAAVTTVAALGAGTGEPMAAALLLRLADGGLAAVWGGYRSPAGFDLTVEVETGERVQVVGNRRPIAEVASGVPPSHVVDFRDRFAAAYKAELEAFLAFARGERPNPCSLEEAVLTQLVVAAAQSALRDCRVVEVGGLR